MFKSVLFRKLAILILVLVGVSLHNTSTARAEKRIALVIGNSAYTDTKQLYNPKKDSTDIAASLKRLKFTVTMHHDLGYDKMRRAIIKFGREARHSDMAVIYFAGHGMEFNGENWLIPVDAKLATDIDTEDEALRLSFVRNKLRSTKNLGLIILDACRNNPFVTKMTRTLSPNTRAVTRGFARIKKLNNSMVVAYSAEAGTTASDGKIGENSPFAAAVIKHLETPNLEIRFVFGQIRDSVLKSSNGEQQPEIYQSLGGRKVFLNVKTISASKQTEKKKLPDFPARDRKKELDPRVELAYWNTVLSVNTLNYYLKYLNKYPNGHFSDLAREKVEEYNKNTAELDNVVKKTVTESKQTNPSPPQQKDNRIITSNQLIRELQQKLYDLNFEPGNADGKIGRKTRRAIREFQESIGLKKTGVATGGLLARLQDTDIPDNWGGIGFLTSKKRVYTKSQLENRGAAEAAIRNTCRGCRNRLIFSGEECAGLALSSNGWGWAVRSNKTDAQSAAMTACTQYGSGCKLKTLVCANGN